MEIIDDFISEYLLLDNDADLRDFCQQRILDGAPHVFRDVEGKEYYNFRKRIADKFEIRFNEVYITGSAKLGFSYAKRTPFSLDSDIDVALVSNRLFDKYMSLIHNFQLKLHYNRSLLATRGHREYYRFLRYAALGWIRPDLLPVSLQVGTMEVKDNWFNFFSSISNGNSEVGNYQVTGGVFKSYHHLSSYTIISLRNAIKLDIEEVI